MVAHTHKRHSSLDKGSFQKSIALFVTAVLLIVAGEIFFVTTRIDSPFVSGLIVGKPMRVFFYNRLANHLTIVDIPENVMAAGSGGYGDYQLASLWKLSQIDKKGGTVLLHSLENSLGIPLTYYIGTQELIDYSRLDPFSSIKRTFSFKEMSGLIRGRFITNISLFKMLALTRLFNFTAANDVSFLDLSKAPAVSDVIQPDGTIAKRINPDGVDAIISNNFTLTPIAKEALNIVIVNNTGIPGAGLNMARVLTSMGMLVVSVKNDTHDSLDCEINADKPALNSMTVKLVQNIFGCQENNIRTDEVGDLTIYTGKSYSERFVVH